MDIRRDVLVRRVPVRAMSLGARFVEPNLDLKHAITIWPGRFGRIHNARRSLNPRGWALAGSRARTLRTRLVRGTRRGAFVV